MEVALLLLCEAGILVVRLFAKKPLKPAKA
jgi:hypothetical protein